MALLPSEDGPSELTMTWLAFRPGCCRTRVQSLAGSDLEKDSGGSSNRRSAPSANRTGSRS